ncbi:hypothetical protein WCX72_12590 [Sulfurimonas sp. HSL1-6]|uniref:hypothetical protein n=1 Tax=Thiomicrolovo immobilis TaxID=3131935 RepID=UPI0031F760AE
MSWKAIALGTVLVIVIAWNAAVYFADRQIAAKRYDGVYDSCHKVWSSRGLYDTKQERNSLTAFRRAFEAGAHGVEVDFSYDADSDRFIIGHGHPRKGPDGRTVYTEKEGGLFTLETLFRELGEEHAFWLDFKNLDHLSSEETQKAIRRLESIAVNGNVHDRLYIEGSNPLRLSLYTDAGFKTLLGTFPLADSNPVASIVLNAYKMIYAVFDITGIAMNYGSVDKPIYGENTRKQLGMIPAFVFHIPDDPSLLQELVHNSHVRVMLVGRDISIDRFAVTACGRE